jgi:hypothetical protein
VTQRRQDRYRVTPCGTVFCAPYSTAALARRCAKPRSVDQQNSWPGKFENVCAGHAFIGSRILASVALLASAAIVEPVSVIDNRVSGRIQDAKTEFEKSRTETGRRNSREIDGILSIIARRRPFADNFKRRPECRIGVSWLARVIHVVEHGVPQGFGAAKCWIGPEISEGRGGQPSGRVGVDGPVGHQSALSLSCATSLAVSRPSSSTDPGC